MPPTGPAGGGLYVICPTLNALEQIASPESRWFMLKLLRMALFKDSDRAGYDAIKAGLPAPFDSVDDRVSWVAEEFGLLTSGEQLYQYFKDTIDNGWFGTSSNWWLPPQVPPVVDGRKAEIKTLIALEKAFAYSLGLFQFGPPMYDPAQWNWPTLTPFKSDNLATDLASELDATKLSGYFAAMRVRCRWTVVLERFEVFAGGTDVLFLTPGLDPGFINGLFSPLTPREARLARLIVPVVPT